MDQLSLMDLLLQRWSKSPKPVARPWDAAELARRTSRITDERLMRKLRPNLF